MEPIGGGRQRTSRHDQKHQRGCARSPWASEVIPDVTGKSFRWHLEVGWVQVRPSHMGPASMMSQIAAKHVGKEVQLYNKCENKNPPIKTCKVDFFSL